MAQKNNLTIQVLSIIGGILTAIFFLGFLVLASIVNEESSLIIGCLFIIATIFISRLPIAPFLDAMNITLYIAGCVLIAYGLHLTEDSLFITLAVISILTFLLSKGFILPFLSVMLFIISFIGEVVHLSFYESSLQIAAIPIMALFLLTNLFETKLLANLQESLASKYQPFHSGLFVSCILLLAGLSVNYWMPTSDGWNYWLLPVAIWIGILIMVQQIMEVMEVKNPVSQVCIYIFCIIISLPAAFAPYLSGSILLILICFHYGYKTECAGALLLFIYAISKYYYDLSLSLLVKSTTLFFTGIVFIIAWYYFTQKRTKHEKI